MNGPQTMLVDVVARERIDSVKEDLRQVTQRLEDFAAGAIEKIRGDTLLASRVEHLQRLVDSLDRILVRGDGTVPSLQSQMDIVRKTLDEIKKEFASLKTSLSSSRTTDSEIKVAEINSRTVNWKTSAALITSIVVSLVSLITAVYK